MSVKIQYLGWASFLLTDSKGNRLLTDPFLAGSDYMHIPKACVEPEDIRADYMIVSHAAMDHFQQGPAVVRANEHMKVLGDHATLVYMEREGLKKNAELTTAGAVCQYGDFKITAYDARHIAFVHFEDGTYLTGEPLVYVIEVTDGPTIFFGGDTSITYDMKLWGTVHNIDCAILGIGGVEFPDGRCLEEMSPESAAIACELLNTKKVIPMHYWIEDAPEKMAGFLEKRAYPCEVLALKYGEEIVLD